MRASGSTIGRWALTALLLLPCLASGKGPTIYEKTDEFKGTTVYFTQRQQPKLEGGSFLSMRYVYMNFLAFKPMPSPQYALQIDAELQDWIFIEAGDSLALKVDGETITLNGLGSINGRSVGSTGVQEIALYAFPLEVLKKLASATSIQFRVYGSRGLLTGTFSEKMMVELRNFAEKAPTMVNDPGKEAPASIPQAGTSIPSPSL